MTTLDIYIDFKSPAAYLALQPTLQLLDEFTIETRWFPYRTNQHKMPDEQPHETQGETHIRVREHARRQMHEKYAGIQGTPMAFPDTPGSTDTALIALLDVHEKPVAFIAAAFRAYWVKHLDLNDPQVVSRLLGDNGYNTVDRTISEFDAHQHSAEELGIVDAPAYVVAGNVFIGREHMPWIRELLSGA